jgi:Flp pilus assembly pilin Flp
MDFYTATKGILIALRSRLTPAGERGASAVEYGVLVSLICAAIVAAVFYLGTSTSSNFGCTGDSIVAHSNQC